MASTHTARSLANITVEFFRPADIGGNSLVSPTPSWTPPADLSATIAPSRASIVKPCPSTQASTLSPVNKQTVHFMKCSRGNGYLYGSTLERLSLSEITGKDLRISFDDVRTDIPLSLLLLMLLNQYSIFMALQKSQLQLYYQQS